VGNIGLADRNDNLTFPQPDIRVGNSPRWELETFKDWLRLNVGRLNA
jgi:hypothetical protein